VNGTRHVVFALAMTALILFAAGDEWNRNVKRFQPVMPAPKEK